MVPIFWPDWLPQNQTKMQIWNSDKMGTIVAIDFLISYNILYSICIDVLMYQEVHSHCGSHFVTEWPHQILPRVELSGSWY